MKSLRLAISIFFVSAGPALAALPTDLDSDGVLNAVDNCRFVANPGNPDQQDAGGLGASSPPDGFGDACQCGDVDGSGRTDAPDITAIREMLADPTGAPLSDAEGERCAVFGDLASCDVLQVVVLQRALAVPSRGPLTDSASAQHCPAAISERIHVATTGTLGADGTPATPMRRITDAVVRARADRVGGELPAGGGIQIHVGPGTYTGSFSFLIPAYEVLPIVLNVPRLSLRGSTVLLRDAGGLPTGTEPTSETILAVDTSLTDNQGLILVTRTTDGGVGDGVTVEGFDLDGGLNPAGFQFPAPGVYLDRVSNFQVRDNRIQGTGSGVLTRLSSGTIEGNLLSNNTRLGSLVTGGSAVHPATVLERGNRATNNLHGIGHIAAGSVRLPAPAMGFNPITLVLEPLQSIFDRSIPADVAQVPDTLTVTLIGNDASDNLVSGIRLTPIFRPYDYSLVSIAQPITSTLNADVRDNTCERNGFYGVLIEASRIPRTEPTEFVQTLVASFKGNTIADNEAASALVTFVYWSASTGYQGDSYVTYKFASGSSYQLTDPEGNLSGYDFDHPVTEPISGAVLGNLLTVNGVAAPHGKVITPP